MTDAAEGTYDAIIVDSSDPVGPAEVLFEEVPLLQTLVSLSVLNGGGIGIARLDEISSRSMLLDSQAMPWPICLFRGVALRPSRNACCTAVLQGDAPGPEAGRRRLHSGKVLGLPRFPMPF